jgi:hypothetical protein
VKVHALVRYGLKDNELSIAGTYLFPQAAMNMAHGHGAEGHWLESDGHALVAASHMLYAKDATWYLCPAEVTPGFTWEAARVAGQFLREVLTGIVKHGAQR